MCVFRRDGDDSARYDPPSFRLGLWLLIVAGIIVLGIIPVVAALWGE